MKLEGKIDPTIETFNNLFRVLRTVNGLEFKGHPARSLLCVASQWDAGGPIKVMIVKAGSADEGWMLLDQDLNQTYFVEGSETPSADWSFMADWKEVQETDEPTIIDQGQK